MLDKFKNLSNKKITGYVFLGLFFVSTVINPGLAFLNLIFGFPLILLIIGTTLLLMKN